VTTHEHNRLSTEDLLNASPDSREHDIEHDDARAEFDNEGPGRDGLGREPATRLDQEPELDRDEDLAPEEELAPDGGITADTEVSPATTEARPGNEPEQAANGRPMAASHAEPSEEGAPLFATAEVEQFRTQWKELQATFVDSPQDAVRDADELVAEIMQNLAATFAEHKRTLEGQWSRGDEVQTEDLRLALRQYRSFFNQLLSV
jgi:hypothetical protein